jgi:uncharacterized protein YprB with RNaseH-like and TPR domain
MNPESFSARLARLRREGAASGEPKPSPELPAWVRNVLARREAEARVRAAEEAFERGPRSSGDPARLVDAQGERGTFAARSELFPREHRHGDWRVAEVFEAESRALERVAKDASLAGFRAEDAIFLDIETTGLSGGAGTHVFLIGLARFRGGLLELWQGFLRSPADSPALLAECAARVRDASCVVSFFGKSFDRHRLEDQMRLHGVAPPFASRPHLDLYHPCRRLYRAGLDNGRLATMERALCAVEREHDLPGALAPAAWFDYLAEREHRLEQVFTHNALDVLSLVTLCAHLGRVATERRADGSPLAGPADARAAALAKLALEHKAHAEALAWFERAIERTADAQSARRLRARRALVRLALDGPNEIAAEIEALAAEAFDEISTELVAALERARRREMRRARREAATKT